ncbi:unnamed protein product, partial [Brassica oleracea var. botrytis]
MVDQLECWVWQASSKHIVPGHLEDSSIANKSLPRKDSMERLGFVRTLLIDNYNMCTQCYQWRYLLILLFNDEWTWEEAYCYLYEDTAFDNIVISPGPGSPIPTCVCLIWNMAMALQHALTGTGLYVWRLCGACPGTSPWTVKVLRFWQY